MKNYLFLLLFLGVLGCTKNSVNTEVSKLSTIELLLQKWTPLTKQILAVGYDGTIKPSPVSYDWIFKSKGVFQKEKTCENCSIGGEVGNWTLSADNKKIVISLDAINKNEYTIIELTADKLVVQTQDPLVDICGAFDTTGDPNWQSPANPCPIGLVQYELRAVK